jgi:hypothetical protein
MKPEFNLFNRREFVGFISKSAAILGVTVAGVARASAAASPEASNPFAYDLSRLQKTDPKLVNYQEVARWSCPRKHARQLGIGPDDQLHICAGNYITAIDAQGKAGSEIALTDAACCVAVAKDGTIFAGRRDGIEVFDSKGERRAAWDSPERKSWFTGLAVGENDVFVADSGKRVVLRYDKSGNLIGRIGVKNAGRNVPGFVVPSPYLHVVIHHDGLLRVNNPGRHQVELYTSNGDLEGAWGKPSAAIDGFCGCCNPIALALLADGGFVTGEKGLPRVKIYNHAGEFQSVVAGVESFPENARACSGLNDCAHGGLDVAVDSKGRIYILDLVTNDVRVMQRKS